MSDDEPKRTKSNKPSEDVRVFMKEISELKQSNKDRKIVNIESYPNIAGIFSSKRGFDTKIGEKYVTTGKKHQQDRHDFQYSTISDYIEQHRAKFPIPAEQQPKQRLQELKNNAMDAILFMAVYDGHSTEDESKFSTEKYKTWDYLKDKFYDYVVQAIINDEIYKKKIEFFTDLKPVVESAFKNFDWEMFTILKTEVEKIFSTVKNLDERTELLKQLPFLSTGSTATVYIMYRNLSGFFHVGDSTGVAIQIELKFFDQADEAYIRFQNSMNPTKEINPNRMTLDIPDLKDFKNESKTDFVFYKKRNIQDKELMNQLFDIFDQNTDNINATDFVFLIYQVIQFRLKNDSEKNFLNRMHIFSKLEYWLRISIPKIKNNPVLTTDHKIQSKAEIKRVENNLVTLYKENEQVIKTKYTKILSDEKKIQEFCVWGIDFQYFLQNIEIFQTQVNLRDAIMYTVLELDIDDEKDDYINAPSKKYFKETLMREKVLGQADKSQCTYENTKAFGDFDLGLKFLTFHQHLSNVFKNDHKFKNNKKFKQRHSTMLSEILKKDGDILQYLSTKDRFQDEKETDHNTRKELWDYIKNFEAFKDKYRIKIRSSNGEKFYIYYYPEGSKILSVTPTAIQLSLVDQSVSTADISPIWAYIASDGSWDLFREEDNEKTNKKDVVNVMFKKMSELFTYWIDHEPIVQNAIQEFNSFLEHVAKREIDIYNKKTGEDTTNIPDRDYFSKYKKLTPIFTSHSRALLFNDVFNVKKININAVLDQLVFTLPFNLKSTQVKKDLEQNIDVGLDNITITIVNVNPLNVKEDNTYQTMLRTKDQIKKDYQIKDLKLTNKKIETLAKGNLQEFNDFLTKHIIANNESYNISVEDIMERARMENYLKLVFKSSSSQEPQQDKTTQDKKEELISFMAQQGLYAPKIEQNIQNVIPYLRTLLLFYYSGNPEMITYIKQLKIEELYAFWTDEAEQQKYLLNISDISTDEESSLIVDFKSISTAFLQNNNTQDAKDAVLLYCTMIPQFVEDYFKNEKYENWQDVATAFNHLRGYLQITNDFTKYFFPPEHRSKLTQSRKILVDNLGIKEEMNNDNVSNNQDLWIIYHVLMKIKNNELDLVSVMQNLNNNSAQNMPMYVYFQNLRSEVLQMDNIEHWYYLIMKEELVFRQLFLFWSAIYYVPKLIVNNDLIFNIVAQNYQKDKITFPTDLPLHEKMFFKFLKEENNNYYIYNDLEKIYSMKIIMNTGSVFKFTQQQASEFVTNSLFQQNNPLMHYLMMFPKTFIFYIQPIKGIDNIYWDKDSFWDFLVETRKGLHFVLEKNNPSMVDIAESVFSIITKFINKHESFEKYIYEDVQGKIFITRLFRKIFDFKSFDDEYLYNEFVVPLIQDITEASLIFDERQVFSKQVPKIKPTKDYTKFQDKNQFQIFSPTFLLMEKDFVLLSKHKNELIPTINTKMKIFQSITTAKNYPKNLYTAFNELHEKINLKWFDQIPQLNIPLEFDLSQKTQNSKTRISGFNYVFAEFQKLRMTQEEQQKPENYPFDIGKEKPNIVKLNAVLFDTTNMYMQILNKTMIDRLKPNEPFLKTIYQVMNNPNQTIADVFIKYHKTLMKFFAQLSQVKNFDFVGNIPPIYPVFMMPNPLFNNKQTRPPFVISPIVLFEYPSSKSNNSGGPIDFNTYNAEKYITLKQQYDTYIQGYQEYIDWYNINENVL